MCCVECFSCDLCNWARKNLHFVFPFMRLASRFVLCCTQRPNFGWGRRASGSGLGNTATPDLVLATSYIIRTTYHYILSDLVNLRLKLKCRCCWSSEKRGTLSSTSSLISPRRPARTFSNCRYPACTTPCSHPTNRRNIPHPVACN